LSAKPKKRKKRKTTTVKKKYTYKDPKVKILRSLRLSYSNKIHHGWDKEASSFDFTNIVTAGFGQHPPIITMKFDWNSQMIHARDQSSLTPKELEGLILFIEHAKCINHKDLVYVPINPDKRLYHVNVHLPFKYDLEAGDEEDLKKVIMYKILDDIRSIADGKIRIRYEIDSVKEDVPR